MEEFKVGDWAVVKPNGIVGHSWYNNGRHPIKITQIEGSNFRYDLNSNPNNNQDGQSSSLYNLDQLEKHFIPNEIPNNELLIEIW